MWWTNRDLISRKPILIWRTSILVRIGVAYIPRLLGGGKCLSNLLPIIAIPIEEAKHHIGLGISRLLAWLVIW